MEEKEDENMKEGEVYSTPHPSPVFLFLRETAFRRTIMFQGEQNWLRGFVCPFPLLV